MDEFLRIDHVGVVVAPKEIGELRNLTPCHKALIETRCASAAGVLLPGSL